MKAIAKMDYLYIVLFVSSIFDVVTGVLSLVFSTLVWQILALSVTTMTLIIAIVYRLKHKNDKQKNTKGIVIIGSLDFATGLISVLVVVWATQILALIASTATFFKSVKIFIQSEKAKKMFDAASPMLKSVIKRISIAFFAWGASKINKSKKEINKGDKLLMDKVKEFFTKLANNIRANKVSLTETLLNGGVWGIFGYLLDSVESVAIEVAGFNITPLFSIIGFIIIELGFYWESFGAFIERISPKLAEKLETKKEKEAQKEKEKAEKEQAIKIEKAKALIAERKAKAEKEAKELAEAQEIERLAEELEKAENSNIEKTEGSSAE